MLTEAFTTGVEKNKKLTFLHNEEVTLHLTINYHTQIPDIKLGVNICDSLDRKVFTKELSLNEVLKTTKNELTLRLKIPGNFLTPGTFKFNVGLHIPNLMMFDYNENICEFSIVDNGSEFSQYPNVDFGCVFPPAAFEIDK